MYYKKYNKTKKRSKFHRLQDEIKNNKDLRAEVFPEDKDA
jgi:DNA repair exonuclease SbcCD ATPase subunit